MASPAASEIVNRVRALMQDADTPYRYSDSDVLDALNDGVQRILQIRPDYFIAVEFDPPAVTALGDTVPVPADATYALTMFVAGYLSAREDEFATDGRAAALLSAPTAVLTAEQRRRQQGLR